MQQQTLKLNEICEIITSPVDKKSYKDETPVLLCNYTDVYYNEFITKNINFMEATASDNEIKKYSLYKGDVVITKDSETPDDIGISTYIAEDIENLVCGYHLAILRPNTKYVNGLYLAYYLKLQQVLNIFSRFANGITRYSLINATYKAVPVLLPPLAEQEKIAEILSLWDKAIEQTKELIAYKEKQKKGLMQKYIYPTKNKVSYRIGKLFNLSRGKVISKQEIEENQGIYPVYSSQTSNNGILGFINTYDYDDELITWTTDGANAGKVFARKGKFNCTNVCGIAIPKNRDLCNLLYVTSFLNNITKKYVSYVGNPKLMNNVFEEIEIFLPPLDEQKAIADILCKADEEIELLKKQLDLYTEQKKGLMQNLLTGKVRVTV